MKRLLLTGFILGTSVLSAQLKDTLNVAQTALHQNYERALKQNPLQVTNLNLATYTLTKLSHEVVDAGLKRVQTPEQSTAYRFEAKGIYNPSEKLRLFGQFGYEHRMEKNMGYNLSSRRTDSDLVLNPNYLLVPKPADWETQNYTLSGGATLKEGPLRLGAEGYYNAQSSYRKADPRPSVLTADYGAKLRAGYQLGAHQLSLVAGVGRSTETNDVMAVNEYINAPAYPDTYVRFSNGYGRVVNFQSYSDFLYKTYKYQFGAGYQYQTLQSELNLNYEYRYALEEIFGKDANSQVYIDPQLLKMKYRLMEHATFGTFLTHIGAHQLLADFGVSIKTGDNYNKEEKGQNYRLTSDKFFLNTQLTTQNKKGLNYGLRFSNALHFFRARDLLGVTDKIADSWTMKLSGLKEIYQNPKATLSLELGLQQYIPLKTSLNYAAASSDSFFYTNVISPDHLYEGLSKTGGFLEVAFLGKLKKDSNYKIFANFEGLFKNGSSSELPDHFNRPYSSAEFGLVIYY
ncbi:DUF6850 family outer membrane beta-barrel protein [Chryseobacterium sp. A301]